MSDLGTIRNDLPNVFIDKIISDFHEMREFQRNAQENESAVKPAMTEEIFSSLFPNPSDFTALLDYKVAEIEKTETFSPVMPLEDVYMQTLRSLISRGETDDVINDYALANNIDLVLVGHLKEEFIMLPRLNRHRAARTKACGAMRRQSESMHNSFYVKSNEPLSERRHENYSGNLPEEVKAYIRDIAHKTSKSEIIEVVHDKFHTALINAQSIKRYYNSTLIRWKKMGWK